MLTQDYSGNILLDYVHRGHLTEASTFKRARDLAGLLLKEKIIIGYRLWLVSADQTRGCATYFAFQTNVTTRQGTLIRTGRP